MDFPKRFGMERHARQCYSCGKELADAQKLSQMAKELNRVSAPPNFEASVLARIQADKAQHRSTRLWNLWVYGLEDLSWRAFASVASGIALICVGAMLYFLADYRGSTGPQSAENEPIQKTPPAIDTGIGADPRNQRIGVDSTQGVKSTNLVDLLGEGEWPQVYVEPAGSDFVEVLVPGPGDRQFIMRLPKTIRMQYGQPSEEYFVRNVSH